MSAKSERHRQRGEEGVIRRSNCWLQAERIARYLPRLCEQRADVAEELRDLPAKMQLAMIRQEQTLQQRLQDLTELIEDEERAEKELRLEAQPERRRSPQKAAA